jgi:cation diffusion facilitator CzcD-associated flavoprotein CzcO
MLHTHAAHTHCVQHLRHPSARLHHPHHLPLTDKYQLWDNIRLNTRLTGAAYDEDRAVWRLTTAGGEEEEVQVLVLAQGLLRLSCISYRTIYGFFQPF